MSADNGTQPLLGADGKPIKHTHGPGRSLFENEAEVLRKAGSCCPNMTPFVLMIALSVHSIFEGMAVGLA